MARPITEADLHPHLLARMEQRGVTKAEIDRAVNEGWDAADAKPGTSAKTIVLPYQQEWEEEWYAGKKVTVYYKAASEGMTLLTVKARCGREFPRR